LKLKWAWEQELVIGGYTDRAAAESNSGHCSSASTRTIGSATPEGRHRVRRDAAPARRAAADIGDDRVTVRRCPAGPARNRHAARARRTKIGFAEWTSDGRLRQPRFLGLRDDKHRGRCRSGAAGILRRFVSCRTGVGQRGEPLPRRRPVRAQ
jgi:bifunctional non-homologous end joining protein LigD